MTLTATNTFSKFEVRSGIIVLFSGSLDDCRAFMTVATLSGVR